jgi:YedE family putative selenium metabolism protein
MGVCVACFTRDIAGALGIHHAPPVQYLRPEILGIIFGAFLSSILVKEHKARGSSQAILKFFFGFFAMFGALVFLGCSWRVLIRIAGGDGNAIVGLLGLVGGIGLGSFFISSGYTTAKRNVYNSLLGKIIPFAAVILFVLLASSSDVLFYSVKGPGSLHVNIWLGLVAGIVVGVLAQKSRFCTVGAFRDLFLIKNYNLLSGVISLLLFAFLANLMLGQFNPGFEGQPIAHTNQLWNFLAMILGGLAFTLGGGCPGRQLILAGEGDTDAGLFVVGMLAGAGVAHNFGIAASPTGLGAWSALAVVFGIIYCVVVGLILRKKMS